MIKKFTALVFIFSLALIPTEAHAQRRIKIYPSSLKSGGNYSYYRYYRRSVRNPYPQMPYYRPLIRRQRSPVQYASFGYQYRNPRYDTPGNAAVIEEEVREEFRTWEPRVDELKVAYLEDEISGIKRTLLDISARMSVPPASREKEEIVSPEKIEKLRKELGELKALLRELKERK